MPDTTEPVKAGDLIACWFSCGAASAVAARLTLEKYGHLAQIAVVNNPVKEEHPDNLRFMNDVSAWLGVPIVQAINCNYPEASAQLVWDKRSFMVAAHGAPCTVHLKKEARQQWEATYKPDWHVLGFTCDETSRHQRFIETERSNVLPVLIEARLTKQDCYDFLIKEQIEPPEMYRLGYPNANCIGCVKATSPTYWNHVRRTHPQVFTARAEQSRRLGAKLVRVNDTRIYLDELDPLSKGKPLKALSVDCGIFCEEHPT